MSSCHYFLKLISIEVIPEIEKKKNSNVTHCGLSCKTDVSVWLTISEENALCALNVLMK